MDIGREIDRETRKNLPGDAVLGHGGFVRLMDDPSNLGARAREEFFGEAQALVDEAERYVVALKGAVLRRPTHAEALDGLFRAVHTLKGLCGLFGLMDIEAFTHSLEDLLDAFLVERLRIEPGEYQLLNDATVVLGRHLGARRAGLTLDDPAFDRVWMQLRTLGSCARHLERKEIDDALMPLGTQRALESREDHQGGAREAIRAVQDRRSLPPIDGAANTLSPRRGTRAARAPSHAAVEEAEVIPMFARPPQQDMGPTVGEIQRGLLDVRRVPVGVAFRHLRREVRRLARVLSKEARLVVTGAETMLYKHQVDEIGTPLLHALRNALDHGLEGSAERVARGKHPEGTITVSAWQSGREVMIAVEDDGGGVDVEAIRRVALAQGLVSAATADSMGPQELVRMLFLPGFSTRAVVTRTSGRGVGLDVMRSAVARLGGNLALRSEHGRFTRITIALPGTLATAACLIVDVAGRRYAIPMAAVAAVELAAEGRRADKRPVRCLAGSSVPLFSLGRWLGHARVVPEGDVVVVISLAGRVCGLLVDRVVSRRDLVFQPLGSSLRGLGSLVGGAESGREGGTLVLDPAALLDHLLATQRDREQVSRVLAEARELVIGIEPSPASAAEGGMNANRQ